MDIEKKTEEEILVENSDFNEGQTDNCIRALQVDDRSIIENVHLSFLTIFNASPSQVTDILDLSDRTSALITYSQFVDNIALRFINFFRQIEQFERLNVDDRLVLIKYNIFPLVMTLKCFHYNPASDCCSPGTNDEAMKHRQFFLLCNQPMSLRDALVNMVLSLVEVTKQDPILISLLLIILIFSRGLSLSENEPVLNDYLSVYQAQSFYTKILWNYLLNQTNETQAIQRWTQLITMIFRIQSVAEQIRQFIHRLCLNTTTAADKIAPIMQSVLHIS